MTNEPHTSLDTVPKPPVGKGFVSLLCYWLAVGLGSGLAKKAPGTFGTLASLLFIPLFLIIPFFASVAITLVACVVGVYICGRASTDMGVHDSGHIVWDEWAGQWLALLPLLYFGNITFISVAASFALFRFFDILKPFPIGYLDKRLHGGLGIMLDDIIAGVFSALIIMIVI